MIFGSFVDVFFVFLLLLQLDRTYNSTEAVQAVQFLRAGGSNPETDAEVETAGWGSQDNLGTRPDKLQELTIDVFSSRRCKRSDYYGRKFTDNMMCAYRVCQDPCNKPHEKEDSCDVSIRAHVLYVCWISPEAGGSSTPTTSCLWAYSHSIHCFHSRRTSCASGWFWRSSTLPGSCSRCHFQWWEEVWAVKETRNLHHRLPLHWVDRQHHWFTAHCSTTEHLNKVSLFLISFLNISPLSFCIFFTALSSGLKKKSDSDSDSYYHKLYKNNCTRKILYKINSFSPFLIKKHWWHSEMRLFVVFSLSLIYLRIYKTK